MSDDRLFASNNAIGRRAYITNLFILAIIVYATHYGFVEYAIPNVVNEAYGLITTWILYFAYFIFAITFFALVERRLFDVCGRRDTNLYKNASSILQLSVFAILLLLIKDYIPFPFELNVQQTQSIISLLGLIILITTFVLIFPKGKISNLSYEEYRKLDRYK